MDMPAAYSIADIVLSTSIEPEAFKRICLEACSMTKPLLQLIMVALEKL